MADQTRHRKPRNPLNPDSEPTDPNPLAPKHTISSLLLSSSPSNETNTSNKKKNNFSSATFRGLGCTASSQVSVPAVIRTSANWDTKKKAKKKRLKTKTSTDNNKLPTTTATSSNNSLLVTSNGNPISLSLALSSSCVSMPDDVWCGAGIGVSTDAASVDCVVSRRPPPPARPKLDSRSCAPRRLVTPEDIPFFETESSMGLSRFHADISSARHNRHIRHGLREGLAEIVMLQGDMMMGGRLNGLDGYRDLRLDVDNMTYEELLELGDKIGHVSTGLREDSMSRCLRRSKISMSGNLSSLFTSEMEKKCSICQEEYDQDDETGRLIDCGHVFHIDCIKQWLGQKNICPICKTAALPKN